MARWASISEDSVPHHHGSTVCLIAGCGVACGSDGGDDVLAVIEHADVLHLAEGAKKTLSAPIATASQYFQALDTEAPVVAMVEKTPLFMSSIPTFFWKEGAKKTLSPITVAPKYLKSTATVLPVTAGEVDILGERLGEGLDVEEGGGNEAKTYADPMLAPLGAPTTTVLPSSVTLQPNSSLAAPSVASSLARCV
eukprot:CAMPEP_0198700766 /NCGR_PEP_ID=MMETSP1468-20131203/374594_1 /TAXON_ID=1461545 /ORGANISM="Mantoniella sp, Strain CCMP1436" /LENGTH=194 /DNA_ID=CAMNT_0044458827 /DNA_START=293 /DNA_END=875 /DNA_ORIENTATION=-